MKLPGRRHLERLHRWVRSRRPDTVLVLGYHRIADAGPGPLGLAVSPRFFDGQMESLVRRAHPLRLDEAARGLASGSVPPRSVAVTFDDGYADTLHSALPVLERHGVPATVFVTTGSLGERFWWDELTGLVFGASVPGASGLEARLRVSVSGKVHEWRLEPGAGARDAGRRKLLVGEISRLLLPLPPSARGEVLQSLRRQVGAPPAGNGSARAMTPAEVTRLSKSPLIEVGSHGVSHPLWAALEPAEQRREAEGSRAALEALTGKAVTSFSYPNGSVSPEAMGIVGQAGFTVGCCSREDVASPATDLLALPRFWVRDRDGASFTRWLERWLHG